MDLLQQLVTIFAENGYLAVFLALMICGAGLPLPEDITLVAGGVIAGLGYANVHVMVALAMFGVLLGDCAIFLLGHHYGARILKWRFVARILTPSRYCKVQDKFQRYGNRVLFFARFLPGMRTTLYLTAGNQGDVFGQRQAGAADHQREEDGEVTVLGENRHQLLQQIHQFSRASCVICQAEATHDPTLA
jgi:membrane protein YqaA with SNARE-associated domain